MSAPTYALIGVGASVFRKHQTALEALSLRPIAVADVNAIPGQQRAKELGCAFYTDYRQLLRERQPDVTVILTPHSSHARIALDVLSAGSHVLVEKPMAVQLAEADAMIAEVRVNQKLLGVVLQHRFRPEIQAARGLLEDGQLGRLQRIEVTATWPRPCRYYQSAPWRGTWRGEGGGVIMNQAPHHLDLLCHLLGQPRRVFAWTRNLFHAIETEDTVHAALEWESGALGYVHISTAEQDAEHIKIVGTKGVLSINGSGSRVTFQACEQDLHKFLQESKGGTPSSQDVPLPPGSGSGSHIDVYAHFHNALISSTPLLLSGNEGRLSLELACALLYSGATHREVDLPLHREAYSTFFNERRGNTGMKATVQKKNCIVCQQSCFIPDLPPMTRFSI
jgi:predicted dehydrogenase